MCSKQPEDFLTLRATERSQRCTDNAVPGPQCDAPSLADLHVQSLEHPEDRGRSAAAPTNAHRIDHPDPWSGTRFLDHDVRCLQIPVKEPGIGDPEDECTDLPGDLESLAPPGIATLQEIEHILSWHVDQFDLQEPPSMHRDDRRTFDHLRRGNASCRQPPCAAGLAGGLGNPQHVLGQQPRRQPPELGGSGILPGSLHQPDAARAILLEAGHGMIGSPTHVRSIPGTSDRVV